MRRYSAVGGEDLEVHVVPVARRPQCHCAPRRREVRPARRHKEVVEVVQFHTGNALVGQKRDRHSSRFGGRLHRPRTRCAAQMGKGGSDQALLHGLAEEIIPVREPWKSLCVGEETKQPLRLLLSIGPSQETSGPSQVSSGPSQGERLEGREQVVFGDGCFEQALGERRISLAGRRPYSTEDRQSEEPPSDEVARQQFVFRNRGETGERGLDIGAGRLRTQCPLDCCHIRFGPDVPPILRPLEEAPSRGDPARHPLVPARCALAVGRQESGPPLQPGRGRPRLPRRWCRISS